MESRQAAYGEYPLVMIAKLSVKRELRETVGLVFASKQRYLWISA
jgi:hypothetical protein